MTGKPSVFNFGRINIVFESNQNKVILPIMVLQRWNLALWVVDTMVLVWWSYIWSICCAGCTFIPWWRHNSFWKGVCGNVQFLHGCIDVSYRSWDKSKNPCLCRNPIFPNVVHHQNLESIRPVASCFPGPDDVPCWEMCGIRRGMGSWYIRWDMTN